MIPTEISLTFAALMWVLLLIIVLRGPVQPRNRRRYWHERLLARVKKHFRSGGPTVGLDMAKPSRSTFFNGGGGIASRELEPVLEPRAAAPTPFARNRDCGGAWVESAGQIISPTDLRNRIKAGALAKTATL